MRTRRQLTLVERSGCVALESGVEVTVWSRDWRCLPWGLDVTGVALVLRMISVGQAKTRSVIGQTPLACATDEVSRSFLSGRGRQRLKASATKGPVRNQRGTSEEPVRRGFLVRRTWRGGAPCPHLRRGMQRLRASAFWEVSVSRGPPGSGAGLEFYRTLSLCQCRTATQEKTVQTSKT